MYYFQMFIMEEQMVNSRNKGAAYGRTLKYVDMDWYCADGEREE